MELHHIMMLIHHKLYDSYKLYYCRYWKWVGVPLPLKHHNFTLQASRAFNMAHTLEQANLLESSVYREQFFS